MLTYFLVYYFVGMFLIGSLMIIGAFSDKKLAKQAYDQFIKTLLELILYSFVWPIFLFYIFLKGAADA